MRVTDFVLRNRSSSFDMTSTAAGAKMLRTNHWKQACIADVYLGGPIKQIYSVERAVVEKWKKINF